MFMDNGFNKVTEKLFLRAVDPSELKEGDHIFVHRVGVKYSHHGIFVGGVYVIHFYPTEREKSAIEGKPCPDCGYQKGKHLEVVKTCLDCFLTKGKSSFLPAGTSIYRCEYQVVSCRPAEEVVKTAYDLLSTNGFGKYNLVVNNCEEFATFCKTGTRRSAQVEQIMIRPQMVVGLAAASVITTIVNFAKRKTQRK